ncbi:MAG: tRNA threonylcarbamoyladenosine dehydratase [Bacilli bacterium]
MMEQPTMWQRNEMLWGVDFVQQLAHKRVLIAGLGGVGSYAAEALARLGVGHFLLVDHDTIERTNLNRQLFALHSTLGQLKTEVAKARILDIHPQAEVVMESRMIDETFSEWLNLQEWDFVVDAIDTLRYKALLMEECYRCGVPMVSSMGMAERVDPTMVRLGCLSDTSNDPVSKQMRTFARRASLDLKTIRVVHSLEIPQKRTRVIEENPPLLKGKSPLGSMVLVPATAGLFCANEALRQWLVK